MAKYCPWSRLIIFYFVFGLLKCCTENLWPSDWFILGVEEATENSHLVKLKFPPTHRFSSSLDRERGGRKSLGDRTEKEGTACPHPLLALL